MNIKISRQTSKDLQSLSSERYNVGNIIIEAFAVNFTICTVVQQAEEIRLS
jgi:hypothetical protein